MVNPQGLRAALHESVDRLLDEYELGIKASDGTQGLSPLDGESISRGEDHGAWEYTWPGGGPEKFSRATWFEVEAEPQAHRVLVAWTTREAWGRTDRKRAVVFGQLGVATSRTFYPWTEFVETDDDRFAAPIPDPSRPRAILADIDRLPPWLSTYRVERSDRLFRSISDGPSLRLVLDADDEVTMVRHGYWVAGLRGRR